ncbi:MAG: glycosyltransferase [Elusimicrobia bacterium]|nr:glycosyltransferase [Elusimicrobiota bacterium]
MRIVLLRYENINGNNGAAIHVLELAHNLKKIGHDVVICAPRMQKHANPPCTIFYIPILNIRFFRFATYWFTSLFYLPFLFITFKPDVLINFIVYYSPAALLTCRCFRIPYLLYVNGIQTEERLLRSTKERILIPFMNIQLKKETRHAHAICTVTKGIKDNLISHYHADPGKITIVKNGVDTDLFKPIDRYQARSLCGISPDAWVIGFVGGLFPWHGLDYLITAAPGIIRHGTPVVFFIIGSGGLLSKLKQTAVKLHVDSSFVFKGKVPFDQIPLYINCFDIGINLFKPVRSDPGDPIKMYEYMACEIPVVASDVPGYGDFIENSGAGIKVDATQTDTLADQILTVLADKTSRREMGKNGRSAILAHHTWLHRTRELMDLISAH